MMKSKICGLVIAAAIGSMAISPVTTFANESSSNTVSVTESSKDQKELKAAFDEKMNKANETWKTLTKEEKAQVYTMLENEMKIEIDVLNKLVEFNILEQTDADILEKYMHEKLDKLKQSEDFPLFRQGHKKGSK